LFLLIVALPLYPELYGMDEISPFTQLVAFRPQVLVVVLIFGLLMLIRRGWRVAAALVLLLAMTGGALTAPRTLSAAKPPAPGTRAMTIMVANVLGGVVVTGGITAARFRTDQIDGTDHRAAIADIAVPGKP